MRLRLWSNIQIEKFISLFFLFCCVNSVNVITAGPSCGKTSTLRALSFRGMFTAPEAASLIIHQKKSEGYSLDEIRSELDFQEMVLSKQREIEEHIDGVEENVFLDRGLPDNIAYMSHKDMYVPDELVEECRGRYDNVFILERLEFEDDETRTEDEKEAEEIHNEIIRVYADLLEYDIVNVPVVPIDERVDIILEHLDKNENPYKV